MSGKSLQKLIVSVVGEAIFFEFHMLCRLVRHNLPCASCWAANTGAKGERNITVWDSS
jgi:hypothetical protein